MLKRIILGLAVSAWAGQATAASQAAEASAHGVSNPMASVAPRPLHAVLRYDASTAQACRNLFDASSEICLLLALHVIRLSEKPQTRGALELVLARAPAAN